MTMTYCPDWTRAVRIIVVTALMLAHERSLAADGAQDDLSRMQSDALVRILTDPNQASRASNVLRERGESAVPALTAALADEQRAAAAAAVLQSIGPQASAAVPALTAALRDTRDEISKLSFAGAIVSISPEAKDATAALARLLQSNRMEVRFGAARLLGSVARPPTIVNDALTRALADPDPMVRVAATESLLKTTGASSLVLESLTREIEHDSRDPQGLAARMYAIRLAERAGADARDVIPAVVAALSSSEDSIRVAAIGTLRKIGLPSEQVIGSIRKCLDDPSPVVRHAADEALRSIENPESTAPH